MRQISWEGLYDIDCPGVMVLPTDTVYGLHARIDDDCAINTLQRIKKRDNKRYFITLISSWSQIEQCGVILTDRHRELLEKLRPGPYTVLLRDHEGLTHSFRWPCHGGLLGLIARQGPLYSTSANMHGYPTVSTTHQLDSHIVAVADYVVDEGALDVVASTIIDILR